MEVPTNDNTMLGVLATGLIGIFGWINKVLFNKTKELADQLSEIPKEYVTKEDFRDVMQGLQATIKDGQGQLRDQIRELDKGVSGKFTRIYDRLEAKRDKT